MPFVTLSFDLGTLDADAAESACFEAGALAVTLSDSRDDAILEPAPGEVRLWPATHVQALFSGETEPATVAQALSRSLGLPAGSLAVDRLADRAWQREWLRDFHAMRFGRRLWVCPHHESVDDPDAVVVRLDPGLAFGTGTHATTALCLEWLDAHLAPGARVIDYGCGSGILAVAAVKLGAASAACFDIDPQALTAARDNAEANGVSGRVTVHESTDDLPHGVDLLLANILAGPLCRLAPWFAQRVRPGGAVVLAGLMQQEAAEVAHAYSACFDMRPFASRANWVGLSGTRALTCSPSAPSAHSSSS